MRRLLTWWILMTKRLLRRPMYIVILFAAPILAFTLTLAARLDSGIVTAALCLTDEGDEAALAVRASLTENGGVVRIIPVESEAEAKSAVLTGKADAAWIIGSLGEALEEYARYGSAEDAVLVYEREDTVLLRLAREKLYAALFPQLSYEVYAKLMADTFGETAEDTLREYYDSDVVSEALIAFETVDGGESEGSYLVSPVRGLLAVTVMLGALASALGFYGEEELYVWLGPRARRVLPTTLHFTAALPVALAAMVSLRLAGLMGDFGEEACALLLLCTASASAAELLRLVCRREAVFAAAMPIVLIMSLALSPIFAEISAPTVVRALLPVYWYIAAPTGTLAVYAFSCTAAALCADCAARR